MHGFDFKLENPGEFSKYLKLATQLKGDEVPFMFCKEGKLISRVTNLGNFCLAEYQPEYKINIYGDTDILIGVSAIELISAIKLLNDNIHVYGTVESLKLVDEDKSSYEIRLIDPSYINWIPKSPEDTDFITLNIKSSDILKVLKFTSSDDVIFHIAKSKVFLSEREHNRSFKKVIGNIDSEREFDIVFSKTWLGVIFSSLKSEVEINIAPNWVMKIVDGCIKVWLAPKIVG